MPALRAGFDTVISHLGLVLFPVALDLVLWLGPHVGASVVLQAVLDEFKNMAAIAAVPTDVSSVALGQLSDLFNGVNFLGTLRTFPIGIASLMAGVLGSLTPLGNAQIWQVATPDSLLLTIFGLTALGWVLGAAYFRTVAAVSIRSEGPVTTEAVEPQTKVPGIFRTVLQVAVFSLLFSLALLLIGFPALTVVALLTSLNSILGQIVLLAGAFAAFSIFVPLFFSPHGMFTHNENALRSLCSSFRLMRAGLPMNSMFVLVAVLLTAGLNYLWARPEPDSWLTLVAILGHGFIATAVLAASFIYYREVRQWMDVLARRLPAKAPTQQV